MTVDPLTLVKETLGIITIRKSTPTIIDGGPINTSIVFRRLFGDRVSVTRPLQLREGRVPESERRGKVRIVFNHFDEVEKILITVNFEKYVNTLRKN